MDRVDIESLGLGCPGFADGFVGCEAFEGIESAAEVIGVDEFGQVASAPFMGLVMEALDGCVLDGPFHAFDLAISPRMAWLGQPMVDVVLGAGILEGIREEAASKIHCASDVGSSRADISWRGEMGAVVGQNGMNLVRDGTHEGMKEVARDPPGGIFVQFGKGELGGSVDSETESTVDFASRRPVGRSSTEPRFRHLAKVFWFMP